MAMTYLAFWADEPIRKRMAKIKDWRGDAQEQFIDPLQEKEAFLRLGPVTDGWVMLSLLDWLRVRKVLVDTASDQTNPFLVCYLPTDERDALLKRLEPLDPRADPKFPGAIAGLLKGIK